MTIWLGQNYVQNGVIKTTSKGPITSKKQRARGNARFGACFLEVKVFEQFWINNQPRRCRCILYASEDHNQQSNRHKTHRIPCFEIPIKRYSKKMYTGGRLRGISSCCCCVTRPEFLTKSGIRPNAKIRNKRSNILFSWFLFESSDKRPTLPNFIINWSPRRDWQRNCWQY